MLVPESVLTKKNPAETAGFFQEYMQIITTQVRKKTVGKW